MYLVVVVLVRNPLSVLSQVSRAGAREALLRAGLLGCGLARRHLKKHGERVADQNTLKCTKKYLKHSLKLKCSGTARLNNQNSRAKM